MDTTSAKHELKSPNLRIQVFEHTLGFSDDLLLEPLVNTVKLRVIELNELGNTVDQSNACTFSLHWLTAIRTVLVTVDPNLLQLHLEYFLADLYVTVIHEITVMFLS